MLTPDLHGHGASPAWPVGTTATLDVGAAAVAREAGAGPLHPVGHSYGAAVPLQLALRQPERVRSLTLYEPVVFGMLQAQPTPDAAADEIAEVAASVAALVAVRAALDAARVFVAYWGRSRAWSGLGDNQRSALAERAAVVPQHFAALFAARWTAASLAALQMPVLLLRGGATRAPARRVSELLSEALPHAQCRLPADAGRVGPITHARTIGHWMAAHIDPVLARSLDACEA